MAVVEEDPEGRVLLPFNPKFTYPIFGEQEKIYGYKDLRIEVSISLCPYPATKLVVWWEEELTGSLIPA